MKIKIQIPTKIQKNSKDESDAEDSQDQGDGEDQSTDSLLQDFENQEEDGTAYEQFFGFLN